MSAEDVVPMWNSILQKKFLEVVGVALSQSQIDTLLGLAKSPGHGIICKNCANKYSRLKREILALEENMTKAINGIINSTFETVIPARAGQKRTRMQDTHVTDHPPAKKLHLSIPPQCTSDTATKSDSPSAVVSSMHRTIILLYYNHHTIYSFLVGYNWL